MRDYLQTERYRTVFEWEICQIPFPRTREPSLTFSIARRSLTLSLSLGVQEKV